MITELRKIDREIDTRGTPTHYIMSLILIIIHVLVIIVTSFPLKSHYPPPNVRHNLHNESRVLRGREGGSLEDTTASVGCSEDTTVVVGCPEDTTVLVGCSECTTVVVGCPEDTTILVGLGWFGCRLAFATTPLSSVIQGKERSASIESKVV